MAKLALAFDVTANDKASRVLDKIGGKVEHTGRRLTRGLGGPLLGLAGAGGVGALIGSSVKLAASFDKTMRLVAVATDTPASKIQDLNALALKMGAATTFSAQQAGDAMLELAKGGLSAAQIKAGALSATLTLASAGGLELGNAAGYIVQGLSTFNLKADKAAEVAAALAGGANASTASVEDMGLALSQVGPGATTAGLTLQETTGVLAAFAQNGIKGSDAGTSLKTMLARLVPTTAKAKGLMEDLGLKFVDAHGNFLDITNVAQQLHDRLGKLSDAERSAALATIFGSDATRAATILAKEGAAGLERYIRATSDKTQAERLAKASTEGTAGALEQMHGAIETAQIALGTALAPVVVDVSKKIGAFAGGPLTDFFTGMSNGTGAGGEFADAVRGAGDGLEKAWQVGKPFLGFIADHPKLFTEIAVGAGAFAAAMKVIGSVKKLPGLGSLVGKATPLPVFVTNPGFGLGGGKGSPLPLPGGGKGGGLPGKVSRTSKVLRSPAAGQVVLMADVVLVPEAVKALKDKLPKLIDADGARRDVERLYGQVYAQASAKDKALLDAHNAAIKAALNEGARGNFGPLQAELKSLFDDLDYGMTKAQRLARSKAQALTHDQIVAFGAAGTTSGKRFNDNLQSMLSGGLDRAASLTGAKSSRIGGSLASGIGTGVRAAMAKVDGLDGSLDRLGGRKALPQVKLAGGDAANRDAVALFLRLKRLDGLRVTPHVGVSVDRVLRDLPKPTGARAGGGPVRAGGAYIVGEREPELFVPDRSGTVYNQRQMAAMGGGFTVQGDVNITVADNKTALSVPAQLRSMMFLAGAR